MGDASAANGPACYLTPAELLFLGGIEDDDRLRLLAGLIGAPDVLSDGEVLAATAPASLAARGLLKVDSEGKPSLDPRCVHLAALLSGLSSCTRVAVSDGASQEFARYLEDGKRRVALRLGADGLLEARVLDPAPPLSDVISGALAAITTSVGTWSASVRLELVHGALSDHEVGLACDDGAAVRVSGPISTVSEVSVGGLATALASELAV